MVLSNDFYDGWHKLNWPNGVFSYVIDDWCNENIGLDAEKYWNNYIDKAKWYKTITYNGERYIFFKNQGDAILFQLTWG